MKAAAFHNVAALLQVIKDSLVTAYYHCIFFGNNLIVPGGYFTTTLRLPAR